MYRLTGQFAGYTRIEDLRQEIELALPQGTFGKKPRGSQI